MKRQYLIMFLFVNQLIVSGQNIGIGTSTPHASAALEINAGNKGLLIPRTSSASRIGIANPAKGLLLYDSTIGSFWFYNGSNWLNLLPTDPAIGWALTGNTGTNATNFIGTTDAQPLKFKVNNTLAGFIDNTTNGNAAFGYQSLFSNTSGFYNTATGYGSLKNNKEGGRNTANGFYALYANISGDNNTATGVYALSANTIGINNVATGINSLSSNTEGNYNTATGVNTLYTNLNGSYNTAAGFNALQLNIDGTNNTATGAAALQSNTHGTSNTAHGMYGLYLNTTGNSNTANGFGALYSNIGGSYNTATGAGALNVNTGSWNTANGAYAMYLNTTGNYNTAIGYEALYTGIGSDNAAVGHAALKASTTGASNTAMGQAALGLTNTGSSNTGIGQHALFSNKAGSNNTALGFFADVASDNLTNATAIGANAVVSISNSIQLGDNNVSRVNTAGSIYVKNGKGIVRSNNSSQKLIQTVIVTVSGTINAYSVLKVPIIIPEQVSDPVLYVGNMLPNGVGAPGISMYITATASPFIGLPDSYSLNVYHIAPSLTPSNFDFQVKVIIIGNN